MNLDEYATLTIQAAEKLKDIGDCKRSIEELEKLYSLDLKKINDDFIEIFHFTKMYQIATQCDNQYRNRLKEFVDNFKFIMPDMLYADSLAIYGKSLRARGGGIQNDEAFYYYARAIGEILSDNRFQIPTLPIHAISEHLNNNELLSKVVFE